MRHGPAVDSAREGPQRRPSLGILVPVVAALLALSLGGLYGIGGRAYHHGYAWRTMDFDVTEEAPAAALERFATSAGLQRVRYDGVDPQALPPATLLVFQMRPKLVARFLGLLLDVRLQAEGDTLVVRPGPPPAQPPENIAERFATAVHLRWKLHLW